MACLPCDPSDSQHRTSLDMLTVESRGAEYSFQSILGLESLDPFLELSPDSGRTRTAFGHMADFEDEMAAGSDLALDWLGPNLDTGYSGNGYQNFG